MLKRFFLARGFVIFLMALQIALIAVGALQCYIGKTNYGLFNIIFNAIFLCVNINTLKLIRKNNGHFNT